jgi:hypothetical protein
MELIFEVLFEFVAQVIFEVVVELGGHAVARVLDTRIGRAIASATLMAGFGFVGGYAWGRHVADIGHKGMPRTLWVSLGLAALAAVLAVRTRRDADWEERVASVPTVLKPTAERFAQLSFLNVTIALGVLVGFNT